MNSTQRRLWENFDEMPRAAVSFEDQRRRVWGFLHGLSSLAVFREPRRENAERAYSALCMAKLTGRLKDSAWRHLGRLLRCRALPHYHRMRADLEEMSGATPRDFLMHLALTARDYTRAEIWPEAASYIERAHAALCVMVICRLVTPSSANRMNAVLMRYASKVRLPC